MTEIEKLAFDLRDARAARRAAEAVMYEAECALGKAANDEFMAKTYLDAAVAKLVNG